MGLLSNFFTKSRNQSLFSFFIPSNAPSLAARSYLKAYALPWVNACIRAIATDVSTIELKLQHKQGGDWQDVDSHEAMDLLNDVNPRMTSDDLFFGTEAYVDLSGDSFWYVAYSNGSHTIKSKPKELWLLDPTRMTILRGGTDGIKGYEYTNDQGKKIQLSPWEVLHFHDFNPEDLMRGTGLVKPAAVPIDIDTYASEHNRNFFFNSALPSMTLETEGTLNDEQLDRLEAKWNEKFQGIKNSHRPAVLEGGLKANILSQSNRDMDFNEGKRLVRDEILAIFNVPKSILGITEDVNRANAEASEYVFAKRVIAPRMRFIATRLTEFYLPLWNLPLDEYRIVVAKDPVPENAELKARVNDIYIKSGVYTRNEVRESEGKEALEGGDVLLVPNNYVPLTHAIKPPEPKPAPDATPADEGDKKPTKAITKGVDTAVEKRVAYFHSAIDKGGKSVLKVIHKQRDTISDRLTGEKAQAIVLAKDDNPNDQEAHQSELEALLFSDWAEWVPLLVATISVIDGDAYKFAGTRILARAGVDSEFDIANPRAVSWLKDRGLQSATQINETFRDRIKQLVIEGVEQGQSIDEIARNIGQFYDDESAWRATRVARTEVMTAYGEGSIEAARQGSLHEKSWRTAGDSRVSDICQQNESVGWIEREDAFPSGDMAPTSHPNCRCEVEFRQRENI